MSSTIRSLVVPVSDLDAAKAVYTALLGEPHAGQPYAPVTFVDVEDLDGVRGEESCRGGRYVSTGPA